MGVFILCDGWYMKKNLVSMIDEYPNLDLICNARSDSVIYDLVPAPTGRKGIPAKHRKRLSIDEDFALSDEKIGDYYTGVRHVLTNLFGKREVLAYVTATTKESGTKRLFFSTIFPEQLGIFCAWHEKAPLNQKFNNEKIEDDDKNNSKCFVFIRYVIMQYDREKGYKTAAWYVRQITYGG